MSSGMAQYRISDPDEMITCPYNPSHQKRAQSFPLHLIKCRKNYTGKDFVTCPFNASHDMPRPELRHHMATCPSKAVIEHEVRHEAGAGNQMKGCTQTPAYKDFHIESEENWDEDISPPIRVGPLHDTSYFTRVKFQDISGLNKQQRKILKDNRLTSEQKKQELNFHEDKPGWIHGNKDPTLVDNLRLPRSQSAAATIQRPASIPQPESSLFAYNVGCGRGYGRGKPISQASNSTFQNAASAGPRGAVGRGQRGLAPPPGFIVPKVLSKVTNDM